VVELGREAISAIVISSTLVAYVIVGLIASRRVKSGEDFLIAGGKLSYVPLFGTYLATYFSALSMLGWPGDMYAFGISAAWIGIFWALGAALTVLVARKYWYYRQLITPPDFMTARYGSKLLELLVGITSFIALVFGIVTQYIAMGIAWSVALGRSYAEGVLITTAIMAVIIAAGGLVSVAWSDVLKAAVFLIAIYGGAAYIFTNVVNPVDTIKRLATTNPSFFDPFRVYAPFGVAMLFFMWTLGVATHAQYLQRITAGRSLRVTFFQYTSWYFVAAIYVTLLLLAMTAKVLFPTGLPAGWSRDYVLPALFYYHSPPAIYALFLAGIVAAALSTADSVIQLATSIFIKNIVELARGRPFSSRARLNLGRAISFALTFLVGAAAIARPAAITYVAGYAWGLLAVGYFAPVFFGLYWRRASKTAAILSVLIGWVFFIVAQALALAGRWTVPISPAALGSMAAVISYVVIALMTKPTPPPVESSPR
jgi:Na+/proline symporter